jgi:anti-sigma28 factor (negative regulator of flagellin synthesis)
MDIKVYDGNLAGAAASGSGRTADTQKVGGNAATGGLSSSSSAAGDQVQLSGTLGRVSQALSDQETQRAAKVAALSAAYRSGTYQPNPAGTARGLVSEALSSAAPAA